MPGWIPLRLRPLLGADLDEVTVESVQKLVGMREDRDLEFKRERYGTSDAQKKEAAYDVAALANASGGVIVVGMEEDGADVAARVSAEADSGDFGAWLHQVVAARVSPALQVSCRSLRLAEGFVHIVSVEPSLRKPHAVHAGDDALRFPIRSGTTKRYMSEPELADMYYRRLSAAQQIESKVDSMHREARTLTTAAIEHDKVAWLLLCCVPSSPGTLQLEDGLPDRWRQWVERSLRGFPVYVSYSPLLMPRFVHVGSVGFRSIELVDIVDPRRVFYNFFAQLGLDGSGIVVFGYPTRLRIEGLDAETNATFDDKVFGDVINGLEILARHAGETGAVGELTIGAQLFSKRPIAVCQDRLRNIDPSRVSSKTVRGGTPIAIRTTTIESVAVQGLARVALTRLISTDLFSSFGVAQPEQVTVKDQLVLEGFHEKSHQHLKTWAAEAGVEVV